jgi:hypothetical protein
MATLLYAPTRFCFTKNKVYITIREDVLVAYPTATNINIVLALRKYDHINNIWVDLIMLNQLPNSSGIAVFEISEVLSQQAVKPELNYYFYDNTDLFMETFDFFQFQFSYYETYIISGVLTATARNHMQEVVCAIQGGFPDWQTNLLAEIGARPENYIRYKYLSLSTTPDTISVGPNQPIIWNAFSLLQSIGTFYIILYDADDNYLFQNIQQKTPVEKALYSVVTGLHLPLFADYAAATAYIKIIFVADSGVNIGEKIYTIDRTTNFKNYYAYRNSLGVFETIATQANEEITAEPKSSVVTYSDNVSDNLNKFADPNNIASLINTALTSRGGRTQRKVDEMRITGKLTTGNFVTGTYNQIIDFLKSDEIYLLNSVTTLEESTRIERIVIDDVKITHVDSYKRIINVEFDYAKANMSNSHNCFELTSIQHHVLPPNYAYCDLVLHLHHAGIVTGYLVSAGNNKLEISANLIGGSYENDTDQIEFQDYSLFGASLDYFDFTNRAIWDASIEALSWYDASHPRRCLVSFLTPTNISTYCLLTYQIFVNNGFVNPISNCLPIICYNQTIALTGPVDDYLYKHKLNVGSDAGEYDIDEYDNDEYYI